MDPATTRTGQDTASATKNAQFFDANDSYAVRVAELETYKSIRRAIDPEIAGAHKLLDVGNGGVFDYDTNLARQITGVDLFFNDTPAANADLPSNVTLHHGDALALKEPDASYDRVLEVSVLHHLIGTDVRSTLDNITQAIDEAYRVLEPGGRLVIMESCVSSRAFAVERRLFTILRWLTRTPVMRHPATLQFPPETISTIIGERFGQVSATPIPVGRWILQFGFRWPTVLTPARPYLFTATRR